MQNIGRYKQMTEFTTENAGTAEWCRASLDGVDYFVKKFQSPVYPSAEVELPEKKMKARILRFHTALENKKKLYERLEAQNSSGALLVPVEVMNYQYHICTIAEFVTGNVRPKDVCHLNPWQRLVLMRTLTKALMNVHAAGVVHSDMKPENVVIEQSEEGNCRLRLIDFDGSFFMEDAPSKADEVHGDPAYFSPEAYRLSLGEDVTLDYRIDIFALGMIMHYVWCGSLPGKPTDQTVGECVLRGGSVVLDESLPLALRMTIMKMLDADPDRRLSLQSVDQVLAEQIKRYPARPLVVIATRKPPEPGKRPDERKKDEEARCTDRERIPARDVRPITILEVDTKGNTLRSRNVDVAFGGSAVIKARSIEGYRLISDTERKVTVSKTGLVSNSTVRFTYERIARKRMSTSGIVWLVILGLAVTIGIVIAIANGNRPGSMTDPRHRVSTITPGDAKTVSHSQTYYFTPEETGIYRIYSYSGNYQADPSVTLSGWNGSEYVFVIYEDDDPGHGVYFDITQRLEKETTYSIFCGGSGTYRVYMERIN